MHIVHCTDSRSSFFLLPRQTSWVPKSIFRSVPAIYSVYWMGDREGDKVVWISRSGGVVSMSVSFDSGVGNGAYFIT